MHFAMMRWFGFGLLFGAVLGALAPSTAWAQGEGVADEPVLTLTLGNRDKTLPSRETTDPTGSSVTLSEPDSSSTPAEPNGVAEEESLQPIPDASQSDELAKIEPASFNGIIPGTTTLAELDKAWGRPKQVSRQGDLIIQSYTVEPFEQVEVGLAGDRVASIVIRLAKAFSAKMVAEQLKLTDVRPVLVANELGTILGQAFPERGVMFAFAPSKEPGKVLMEVEQIVLEPISAEPFLLRAETNLDTHYVASLNDLEQAVKLEPDLSRAHWLRARVLAAMGKQAEAVRAAARAVELDAANPRYRVTYAQILSRTGDQAEAVVQCEKALENSERRPHVKARALCLLGDLAASGPKPDLKRAIDMHMKAVQAADPLAVDPHPAIRLAAKEVLIDAHLGAANDIAWGNWNNKEIAVTKWIERAGSYAEELIANDGGTAEHRFRVATRGLSAAVGAQGLLDPSQWAKQVVDTGTELIAAASDPIQKQQYAWDVGMALYDALQIYQTRRETELALAYGEKAIAHVEQSGQSMEAIPEYGYLLGRLYFRMGAIHSLTKKNHKAAITWFDKAIPLLEQPLPKQARGERGRHGETFVSIGISYWETGQREKALGLTEHGVALMREAVEEGALPASALAVPYGNLATMHRVLGNEDEAAQFAAKAAQVKRVANTAAQAAPKKGAIRR